jgi:hypothetical protein
MCRPRVLAAAVLALLWTALASAGSQAAPRTREQRETEARTACGAGRVEDGIEILAQLFTEFGHPNYIYNQARCYQQNGKAEQAISRFKEFLRAAPDISAEERTRVERFIKELESDLPAAPAAAAPSTEGSPPVPPEPPVRPAPPPLEVSRPTQPRTERSRGMLTAAVALGAVAVAGLTTGIVSTVRVHSLQTEVETARIGQFDGPRLSQQEDKAHRFEALQWVGYGVGAAAAAGSVVCLVLDHQEGAADHVSRVRLLGTLGPGGQPGLALAGRF